MLWEYASWSHGGVQLYVISNIYFELLLPLTVCLFICLFVLIVMLDSWLLIDDGSLSLLLLMLTLLFEDWLGLGSDTHDVVVFCIYSGTRIDNRREDYRGRLSVGWVR